MVSRRVWAIEVNTSARRKVDFFLGEEMTDLVKYEAARHALQEAHSVDEVKDIRDKAQAMLAYGKQAKDTELIWIATDIKIRAERKAGQLLLEMKLNGERDSGKGNRNPILKSQDTTPKLADFGISKDQSSRWQKLAAVPERKFEQAVAAAKEIQAEVTTASMLRLNTTHVSHNSGENEWYTPPEYINAARSAMGDIDCDPASSAIANKTVKAEIYFTEKENGLANKWNGRVWMNPPYAQPLCQQFCSALVEKYQAKEIEQACVLVNNATETVWQQEMLSACAAVCFVKGRVRFIDIAGNPGAPLQGQVLLYFGNSVTTFKKHFESFGLIFVPI